MYGYTGKIARVDLSSGHVTYEKLDENIARQFIGGTGLGVKYLYDEVPVGTEWSDAENRYMISGGPLSGTQISGSGTVSIVTKGPMTNGAATTQANGYFGAYLKIAGFDSIIIQGKSDKWVYLHIHDDVVEIRDADHLVGKNTWETADMIKEAHGKKARQMSVACIGPAGENLVKFACTVVDGDHVASKNGNGAVLGSKLVKAMAVERGSRRPDLFDKEALNGIAKEIHDDIEFAQFGYGTATVFDGGTLAQGGNCIMYNYSKMYDPNPDLVEKINKFGSTYMREAHDGKRDPCWACNA
ncbi:MAG TPA: aldehyde ferredoxin oxidoreductase N-terminal domain-containing protein, partial [Clostridiaceae bacterium]|nr:aldehyde ferredoxin oxidoreductase N-terminal domain-containing protein [Clostridiaceae bacterium]